MESVRTMLVNRKLEGQPCGWCTQVLVLGDPASACTTCESAHHQGCWGDRGGCSKTECVNAPLRRLDVGQPVSFKGLDLQKRSGSGGSPGGAPAGVVSHNIASADTIFCTACGKSISASEPACVWCGAINSPDGLYHGPKINAPGATSSLVWGLVGLVFFGIILGFVAMSKAKEAKALIARDPRYQGEGIATAGYVLGILDIVLFIVVIGFNATQK